MKEKIICADDESGFRRIITTYLENQGYQVLQAENGEEVLVLLGKHPDTALVILDVMMPVLDGWQSCEIIREFSDVPILMLTALDEDKNQVKGLDKGADDYVSKPFSYNVLVSRVKALLRRSRVKESKIIRDGKLTLHEEAFEVMVGGENIKLTPREFHLLKYFLTNKDIVLSRDLILRRIWGSLYEGDPRTLDTHIKSLRAKLGTWASHIITIRNQGYCYKGTDP